MTKKQFNNLKVGDVVRIKTGRDKDKLGMVRYIEDEAILIKSINNDFIKGSTGSQLRLTTWSLIDVDC